MIEKRFIKQVYSVLEKLNTQVMLFDMQGECQIPADGAPVDLPKDWSDSIIRESDRYMLMMTPTQPPMVLGVSRDLQGAEDVLTLISAMIVNMLKSGSMITDGWDLYRRVIREEISGNELETLANEYQIRLDQSRCVILFHMVQVGASSAFTLLNEMVPQSETDALVEMDRHTLAFLKDMDGVEGVDELRQFAEAVQETLVTETACLVTVSIGTPKATLASLGESYREAKRAMEVGHTYRPGESVHVFSAMMLERFLSELPQETTAFYHHLLFNRKTARLFNDEMLHTIEMFFKKDLNLSDTARQLYIHRNTLVYRLDKIQRQSGLDLRKFEDAVTFKILLELKRSGYDKPHIVH